MTHCKASVFIATSLDGFIARPDGELDWLPTEADSDMGYGDFIRTVDLLVMGRHTFEKVLSFGDWPYDLPVRVLSHQGVDIPTALRGQVEQMAGQPAALLDAFATHGFKHAYIDGGETIQAFLAADLVERLILTRVPVLIGQGLPLFGALAPGCRQLAWDHIKTFTWGNGVVQSHYQRHRA